MSQANSNQQAFWERRVGAWEKRADATDPASDDYGMGVMNALGIEPGERVVDIGCGPGMTAIELAKRVGPGGEVVGVDISSGMVDAATRRATAAGVSNVRFVVADAQTDSFGEQYAVAFSRFGVMFFQDPALAFANIRRSLRPGGRLGCVVWGPLADNPWMTVPTTAAAGVLKIQAPVPQPGQPGPFSLDRADRVVEVLTSAGFSDIEIEQIHGWRHITVELAGNDLSTLLEVGPIGEAYRAAADATREQIMAAVESALEPYRQADGWHIPGVALKVMARQD